VVAIEGALRREVVPELDRVCKAITGPMCLDLANVTIADDAGLAALRVLSDMGAAIAGASPYLRMRLDEKP